MPSLTRSSAMEATLIPPATPIPTEMPPVNFLRSPKIALFNPILIFLFRNHFSSWVDANKYGTRADFVELYKSFRDLYKNHVRADAEAEASGKGEALDSLQVKSLDDESGLLLNQFWEFIMGMGQLASCFDLSAMGPADQGPESSSKAKKEVRRYNHVLAKIVATNMEKGNEGPWDIPKQARGKLPDAEGMMLEMFVAMKNNTDVLDYFDTKPYRDHWYSMTDKDFWHLATSLFKHLNDLHQGRDFVEGFRYVDRYHSLVSLLRNCKGTIYFMSRPSTYEDVLLNPHMMELRFADNQKNNAKKKLDNRELAARRAQEFFHQHGTDPPPKTRSIRGAAKGGRSKRAISEAEEDENLEEEASSPAGATPSTNTRSAAKKRRTAAANATKRSLAKGKGKAAPATATATAKDIFVPPVSTQALIRATTQVLPPPLVGADPKRAKQLESGKRQKQQYQHFQALQDYDVQVEVAPEQFGEGFAVPEPFGINTLDPRLRESGLPAEPDLHPSRNAFLFGSEEEGAIKQWANNRQVTEANHSGNFLNSGAPSYNQTLDQGFVQNIINTNYETVIDTTYASGEQGDPGNISVHNTSAETDWNNSEPIFNTSARPVDADGNSFFDFEDASFGPNKFDEMEKGILEDPSDPDR